MTSILEDTRDALGLIEDDTSFDGELTMHINSALSDLVQNGVGTPLIIKGVDDEWNSFKKEGQEPEDAYMFGQVKQYVYLKTKLLFDPPPPSTVQYVDQAVKELLWRLREHYNVIKEV